MKKKTSKKKRNTIRRKYRLRVKQRKRNKANRRRKQKKANVKKITRFIQGELKEKIIEDLKDFRISSEAELRTQITHHLINFLPNPRDSKYRLSTGLRVRKQKIGKRAPDEVDIVIQYLAKSNFRKFTPDIMIELKEIGSFSTETLKSDIRKLEEFKKKKICKYGYAIYFCRSGTPEKELQKRASRLVKLQYDDRIIPIIINAYEYLTTDRTLFDTRWDQSKSFAPGQATATIAAGIRIRNEKKNGGKKMKPQGGDKK